MSRSSTITIWKKHTNSVFSDKIDALKKQYKDYDANNSWSSNDNQKEDFPLIFDSFYGNYEAEKSADLNTKRDRYFLNDGHSVDHCVDADFSSGMCCVWDELELDGCRHSSSMCLITREVAKEILQAVKYLLINGEFDKKIEDILGNKWIRILGDGYPKYEWRKNENVYVDREDPKHLVISKGDSVADSEAEEENEYKEIMYKRLQSILEVFLDQWVYDKNEEFILTFTASA